MIYLRPRRRRRRWGNCLPGDFADERADGAFGYRAAHERCGPYGVL